MFSLSQVNNLCFKDPPEFLTLISSDGRDVRRLDKVSNISIIDEDQVWERKKKKEFFYRIYSNAQLYTFLATFFQVCGSIAKSEAYSTSR